MTDIRRVLRLAAIRLWMLDTVRRWSVFAAALLGTILVGRIVEQVAGFTFEWTRVAPFVPPGGFYSAALLVAVLAVYAVAAGLVLSGVWSLIRARKPAAVARALDERAGLKESLSTALYIERSNDPWSRAVVETASQKARGVNVPQAMPMESPKFWPVPVATTLGLVLVWLLMPKIDLSGKHAEQVAEIAKKQEIVAVKAEVQAQEKKLEDLLKKAKVEDAIADGENEGEGETPKEMDPEALRRTAVKKLTNVAEQLEKMKEDEKAPQIEALKEQLKQLRQPGRGPLNDFSRQLSRGDFNKAKAALDEMSKQLGDAAMPPEQKEELKKQLENMSKQMEKLADAETQVAKEMEKKGLDKKSAEELAKKAAQGGEELKKALDQMKDMNEEQKQQMMEMAKSMMKACEQCSGMSESMSKMAKGMSQEGMQQEGAEGMEKLAAELSEMELMESDMENLDAALDEAKKQLAEMGKCLGGDSDKEGEGDGEPKIGSWKQGDSRKIGTGSGAVGRGDGPSPDAEAADYTTEKKKANVKTGGGPIIGQRLVYGEQIKGESKAQFADTVEASVAEASEAIESKQIPREYHDAVKSYFGRLQEKVKKDAPAQAPAAKEAGK